ncbi:immunoglobulin lambda-1 light chain-like [Ammospiza caudacuta]|uniref:immunoglobulin lambda-1 light chain-like n=1 Tax=Ammospiza caudacuta TaxID=2857398 RepID=UPI00273A1A9F|nr:immunoglobulin lambda-1 light chain-like [Ammospiza caudacuta]
MLLPPLLALAAAWSYGQAQVILKQREVSITRGHKTTASMDCIAEGIPDFQYANIHWYRQVAAKAPERILYIGPSAVSYDDNAYRNKYSSSKKGTNVCTLTIKDINSNDVGSYYCAYWHSVTGYYNKVFGSGTKLIVSDKRSSPPKNSEILQTKHKNQIMYVCFIEKFYPEVITVTWTEDEKEVTDNVVKGDAWQATKEEEYSIASWLTVPAESEDKKYYCKYEHEGKSTSLPTQEDSVKTSQDEDCRTVFSRDQLMHRTAYLVYIILLLKSSMYNIILFFIFRMWAYTKHRGKKA